MTYLLAFDGVLPIHLGVLGSVLCAVGLSMATTGVVSIYAHRYMAHGAVVRIHPVLVAGMRTWTWIATGTNCRRWAALHIKHHRVTDRPGDPHSPQVASSVLRLGPAANWRAYRRLSRDDELLRVHPPAHRAAPDRWDEWLFDRTALGVTAGFLVVIVVFGPALGLLIWWLHVLLYLTNTALVNSMGHGWGYQRFTNYGARYTGNSVLLAFVTAGENLHNNHHGDPISPYLAHARWEFVVDWPSLVLALWVKLGWAEVQPRRVRRRGIVRWQFRTTARAVTRLRTRRDDTPGYALGDSRSYRRALRWRERADLKLGVPHRLRSAEPLRP